MCGILLLFSAGKPSDSERFRNSLNKLAHRGPDGEGIFYKDSGKISKWDDNKKLVESELFLGHRRLSIIDLTTGTQPMIDETGNYAIVFNGEIFNYRSLQKELISSYGVEFKTSSDTEVLLKGLILEGSSFLHKCNGMWSFGFYDLLRNKLFISRDRFGIKPLYYTVSAETIVFSSEIKALLDFQKPSERTDILDFYNKTGLSDFSKDTFFENIYQVMPGHNLTVEKVGNQLRTVTEEWYQFSKKSGQAQTLAEFFDIYKYLLDDSIKIRLESDVEVGSLLSGGIDSSIVVDVASIFYGQSGFKTFSGVSQNPAYDESFWIDKVIEFNPRIVNEKISLEYEVNSEEIDRIILAVESPFSTSSVVSQNRLFKAIKPHGLKVILDGQGSDEINLGYDKFFGYALRELVRKGKVKKAISYSKDLLSYQSKKHAIFHFVNAFTPAGVSDKFRNLIGYSSYKDINEMLFLSKNMTLFEFEKLLYQKMLLPIHLRYLDRNSMQYSIEARSPFLDHRLVEYSLSLPVDIRLGEGRRKGMLLEVMRQNLPHAIYSRKNKIGFKSDDAAILKGLETDLTTFKNYTTERWKKIFFERD